MLMKVYSYLTTLFVSPLVSWTYKRACTFTHAHARSSQPPILPLYFVLADDRFLSVMVCAIYKYVCNMWVAVVDCLLVSIWDTLKMAVVLSQRVNKMKGLVVRRTEKITSDMPREDMQSYVPSFLRHFKLNNITFVYLDSVVHWMNRLSLLRWWISECNDMCYLQICLCNIWVAVVDCLLVSFW